MHGPVCLTESIHFTAFEFIKIIILSQSRVKFGHPHFLRILLDLRTVVFVIFIYIYMIKNGKIMLGTAQNMTNTQYTMVRFNFLVTHYP